MSILPGSLNRSWLALRIAISSAAFAVFVACYVDSAVASEISDDTGTCNAATGDCPEVARKPPGLDDELKKQRGRYWADLKNHGLEFRIETRSVEEKVGRKKQTTRNRTATVVSTDVFYGRHIIKIPRAALLSVETAQPVSLRKELLDFLFDSKRLEKEFNITGEDNLHLLSLAYPLIAMSRDPASVFRDWVDRIADERLTVLELTKRQRRLLKGTTVEGAYAEMIRNRNLIRQTAGNLSFFEKAGVGKAEATWALAVIMRHARVVHPHQDVRDTRNPRMYLFPFVEMLNMQLHPDAGMSVTFQEEIVLQNGKREEEMVVQIAKKDMPKGEEVFLWPGRLSNSEMIVRHGFAFDVYNPIGIGRNITQPPNWDQNPNSKVRKEYAKYDCNTLEAFELRFSNLGKPSKAFVRCYRVSWFLTNGWYSPGLQKRRRELAAWPPPKKYLKDDWLSWTQADQELVKIILEYCRDMRERLKEAIDSKIVNDFRKSKDPLDKTLLRLRSEESKTFKECMNTAKDLAE